MFSKKYNQLLARVNFPLYTVQVLNERHILVAGGGGSARSGIPNVIEIYELINNGSTCRTERVSHYETGKQAIMNCTVHNAGKYFLLFAGMEGDCKVFKITYEMTSEAEPAVEESLKEDNSLRKRNVKQSTNPDQKQTSDLDQNQTSNLDHSSKLVFKIQPLESFQTDFSEEPFQKQVKFSPQKKLLVTGGCDGHIRFWKPPNLKEILDVKAHSDDVDDMDISPCGKMIVTVSRDGFGKVWNSDKGTLITELDYTFPKDTDGKFIFRSCRFGLVEDTNSLVLFCTLNPAIRKKPPLKSYLCKWDTRKFSLEKFVSTGSDMLSAMAVSANGHFIGLGSQDGGIKMYIAFSLQLIYNVDNVHGIFVTSVNFLPTSEESRRITGGHEASLLSVSVDNHILVHHIPVRESMSLLTLITFFFLTLFLVFVLMDFFNL